jgi:hypothetical protein
MPVTLTDFDQAILNAIRGGAGYDHAVASTLKADLYDVRMRIRRLRDIGIVISSRKDGRLSVQERIA